MLHRDRGYVGRNDERGQWSTVSPWVNRALFLGSSPNLENKMLFEPQRVNHCLTEPVLRWRHREQCRQAVRP